MKVRITAARWVMVLLLLNCAATLFAFQQRPAPIKKKGLIDALGIGGLAPAELISQINQRGVNFRLAYDDEEEIRNAGASPAVLDAIRKHYRSEPISQADKTNAETLLKSSQALLDARNASSALPVVNQALALDQDDANAFVLRGQIYLATGQAKKAKVDLDIALEITPGNAQAKSYLAEAENSGSGAGGAVATGLDIPTAGHVGFLGFRTEERNGQAVIAGVLPSGSAARGGLLVGDQVLSVNGLSMKDFADQYVTTQKLSPGETMQLQVMRQGQPLTLQMVALSRPAAGQEAFNYYSQLIQQYPGNPEAYLFRASADVELKNPNGALEDLNTFVRLNPGDTTGYRVRANVKASLGDQAGAKTDEDEAARLAGPANGATPSNTLAGTNVPAGSSSVAVALPERWNLLQFNKNFTIKEVDNHLYIQGVDAPVVADAVKTTDKNGNVVYKGKWHQRNAYGVMQQWNMTLKTVTPQRIEGTVLTLIVRGVEVTFLPSN